MKKTLFWFLVLLSFNTLAAVGCYFLFFSGDNLGWTIALTLLALIISGSLSKKMIKHFFVEGTSQARFSNYLNHISTYRNKKNWINNTSSLVWALFFILTLIPSCIAISNQSVKLIRKHAVVKKSWVVRVYEHKGKRNIESFFIVNGDFHFVSEHNDSLYLLDSVRIIYLPDYPHIHYMYPY